MAVAGVPFLRAEVPVRDGPIPEVFAEKHIQCTNHMPHHAVSHDQDLFKTTEDLAYFFRREPAHVALARDERGVKADASTTRNGLQHGAAISAERRKGGVQVE